MELDSETANRPGLIPPTIDVAAIRVGVDASRNRLVASRQSSGISAQQTRDAAIARKTSTEQEINSDLNARQGNRDDAFNEASAKGDRLKADTEKDLETLRKEANDENIKERRRIRRLENTASKERDEDVRRANAADQKSDQLVSKDRKAAEEKETELAAKRDREQAAVPGMQEEERDWTGKIGDAAWKTVTSAINPVNLVYGLWSQVTHIKDRGSTAFTQAKAADASDLWASTQALAVAFYEVTGAMMLYQSVTGEDPLRCCRFHGQRSLLNWTSRKETHYATEESKDERKVTTGVYPRVLSKML